MTDIYDRATEAEEQYRARALAEHAARTQTPAGDWRELSAKWCEGAGCGERIPDERRRAVTGVRFCVACQAGRERKIRANQK
ncbi:MAG: TraR/DksA C4-type zinc finger protein [Thermoleophilia bacterium]|nr:TraR/DksA C4-type zinc finger protein [Thermoleophilia bacterium]